MAYNNDYLTQKQIANALAGVCGIVTINTNETYTGSFIKVCGIDMNFSVMSDGVKISINLESELRGQYTQMVVFCEQIENNGGKHIYVYNTGLKQPELEV